MSNTAEKLVYFTAGRRETFESQHFPHCAVPCPNLHSSLPLSDLSALAFFSEYPYRATYALPVVQPYDLDRAVLNGRDPSLELCKLKHSWHFNKKLALTSFKEKNLPDLSRKEIRVHPSMAKVLNVVKNDPDEYFDASYNSYYTVGNLSCDVVLEGKKYFTSPTASNNKTLELHPLVVGSNHFPDSPTRTPLRIEEAEKSPFFQLTASNDVILTRQRNTCVLLQLKASEQIDANILHVAKHQKPFYSCCYDPRTKSSFYLSANWVISVRDVQSEKDSIVSNLPCEANLWGCIRCHDENVLLLSNRTGVHLLDLRVSPKYHADLTWEIKTVTDECEEIYINSESNDNNVYVTTNHQLLALDLRKGWNQRWTHGIAGGPGLLSVLTHETGNESILIGSLLVDDVVHVENIWNDANSMKVGSVPPYSLPSLTETLHKAHSYGFCLSPIVHSRFRMALTGLCSYVDDDGNTVHVLRRTSVGDVFHQRLFRKSAFREDNIVDLSSEDVSHLENWEKCCDNMFVANMPMVPVCYKVPDSQVEEISRLLKQSSRSTECSSPDKDNESNTPKNQHWKYSKEQLFEYKDSLAPKILEVWKIDEDDWSSNGTNDDGDERSVQDLEIELEDSDEEEDHCMERVINWLRKIPPDGGIDLMDDQIRDDIARLTDKPIPMTEVPQSDSNQSPRLSDKGSTTSNAAEITVPESEPPAEASLTVSNDLMKSQVPAVEKQDVSRPPVKRKFVAGF